MNKLLAKPSFWLAVAIIILGGLLAWSFDRNAQIAADVARLAANQETLLGQVEYYKSENGELVASVQALTMQRDEFEELLVAERNKVQSLGIRIKDLESMGEVDTKTDVTIEAPILPPDTIYINEPVVGTFEWHDPWVRVVGELHPESIKAQINITDTITIVAHRKPKGWWIFKCKGKITRYDAMSANPHTTINHIEYVELRD